MTNFRHTLGKKRTRLLQPKANDENIYVFEADTLSADGLVPLGARTTRSSDNYHLNMYSETAFKVLNGLYKCSKRIKSKCNLRFHLWFTLILMVEMQNLEQHYKNSVFVTNSMSWTTIFPYLKPHLSQTDKPALVSYCCRILYLAIPC